MAPHRTVALLVLALLGACAPEVRGRGPSITTPAIEGTTLRMSDGMRLAFHEAAPQGPPRATILAIHGFNDHAAGQLRESTPPFVAAGMRVVSYDQRGHGTNPDRGVWPGTESLLEDAVAAIRLVRARHPEDRFFVLGESMGGNIALMAADRLRAEGQAEMVDGWIVVVPALWTLDEMNPVLAASFRLVLLQFPQLGVMHGSPTMTPTDNEALLARLDEDPLIPKNTRVDFVAGLLDLNGTSRAVLPRCCAGPTLFVFGARDRVIEQHPTTAALRGIPAGGGARIALFPEAWHLPLRDLNRQAVAEGIRAFMANPRAPLPRGVEDAGARWVATGQR
jgi:alpha-beta hydrolase superfamily lysophospholipase